MDRETRADLANDHMATIWNLKIFILTHANGIGF